MRVGLHVTPQVETTPLELPPLNSKRPLASTIAKLVRAKTTPSDERFFRFQVSFGQLAFCVTVLVAHRIIS